MREASRNAIHRGRMGAYPSAQAVTRPADHVMLPFFHRLDQIRNIPARQESVSPTRYVHCGHIGMLWVSPGTISKHTVLTIGRGYAIATRDKANATNSSNRCQRRVLRDDYRLAATWGKRTNTTPNAKHTAELVCARTHVD